ncbi:MAG: YggS family pyridoxal phosphate-dependent enzyme [Pirellulales bacterium]
MNDNHTKIAHNLRLVRERIARAAEQAGRSPRDITLVAVTKYVGADEALALAALGCLDLGESRPQELWHKADDQRLAPVHWHLIGHLQRNKVARTVPLVKMIHSIDSERLLAAVDEAAALRSEPVRALLEINTSGETAKHGLTADAARQLVDVLSKYPNVIVQGLMTMAPLEGGVAAAAKSFAALRDLRDQLARSAPAGVHLTELSMGMTSDFEVAIQEGATIVRIGTALWEGVKTE